MDYSTRWKLSASDLAHQKKFQMQMLRRKICGIRLWNMLMLGCRLNRRATQSAQREEKQQKNFLKGK